MATNKPSGEIRPAGEVRAFYGTELEKTLIQKAAERALSLSKEVFLIELDNGTPFQVHYNLRFVKLSMLRIGIILIFKFNKALRLQCLQA